MSFGGKLLLKTRKEVPGTYRQEAWQDTWKESIDIDFDGELTPEIQKAIIVAFMNSKACRKGSSSFGALRWGSPDNASYINKETRQLVIDCAVNLAD